MKNTFFSSDMHFRHKNIIKYCNRPYADVDEMAEGLIANHNSRVNPDDVWYHMGDFGFASKGYLASILTRLNGYKIFLRGNHDDTRMMNEFLSDGYINEFHSDWVGKIRDLRFHMYHFPIQSWEGAGKGVIHLHGHSHGSTPSENMLRMDVGVDCHNWFPVSYDEVVDWAKKTREKMGAYGIDPGRDRE